METLTASVFFLINQGKRADATQIFHDTAGWKHLETSMRYAGYQRGLVYTLHNKH